MFTQVPSFGVQSGKLHQTDSNNPVLGKVAQKKSGKSVVFCQTGGGGVLDAKPLFWGLKKGQKWPKNGQKITLKFHIFHKNAKPGGGGG